MDTKAGGYAIMRKSLETATNIRKFNRFYLPYFDLLTQKYLNTEYSIAEARILYEIYECKTICARDIASKLHVDKGYLSRILKKLESKSLIKKALSPDDSRKTFISLTERGETLAERLIMESNRQIEKKIMGISDPDLDELSYHFAQITKILEGKNGNRNV